MDRKWPALPRPIISAGPPANATTFAPSACANSPQAIAHIPPPQSHSPPRPSHFAFPNVAVNDFGDVIIAYAKFTTNGYPSAAYRVRYYNDPRFTAEEVFASGTDYYVYYDENSRNRWGDYTTSVVDPANNRDFWTLGQYATSHLGANINTSGTYGLRWANVLMPFASNDNFADAITLSGTAGTNEITMQRLTREAGEP